MVGSVQSVLLSTPWRDPGVLPVLLRDLLTWELLPLIIRHSLSLIMITRRNTRRRRRPTWMPTNNLRTWTSFLTRRTLSAQFVSSTLSLGTGWYSGSVFTLSAS